MPSTSGLSPIKREFELEAGQDGAQIVRHAGQHRGAFSIERSMRAFISKNACAARRTFPRRGAEVRRLAALAEAFGGVPPAAGSA